MRSDIAFLEVMVVSSILFCIRLIAVKERALQEKQIETAPMGL
jgi:hypothetical protein